MASVYMSMYRLTTVARHSLLPPSSLLSSTQLPTHPHTQTHIHTRPLGTRICSGWTIIVTVAGKVFLSRSSAVSAPSPILYHRGGHQTRPPPHPPPPPPPHRPIQTCPNARCALRCSSPGLLFSSCRAATRSTVNASGDGSWNTTAAPCAASIYDERRGWRERAGTETSMVMIFSEHLK